MGKVSFDKELARKLLSEFVGTAMLLTLGCIICAPKARKLINPIKGVSQRVDLVQEAEDTLENIRLRIPLLVWGGRDEMSIGWGLTVLAVVHIWAFLSGAHINPVVSASATILGLMDWAQMLLYMLAQLFGSLLGYLLAFGVAPENSGLFCVTYSHALYPEWKILVTEFMLTSILCLAVCAIWDKRSEQAYDSVAVRIGLVFAGLVYSGVAYSGSSMNFFRTLAPGLIQLEFHGIWAYFVGHLLACLMPVLWRFVLSDKQYLDEEGVTEGLPAESE